MKKHRRGLAALFSAAALVAATVTFASPSWASTTLPTPAAPSIPAGSQIKVQGVNGGASIGGLGTSAPNASAPNVASPDSEPAGYCAGFYEAYDGSNKVNFLSSGVCTADIPSMLVEAFVYKGGLLKASNSSTGSNTSEEDATATYSCGSSCAGTYVGDDSQYFTSSSGWAGSNGTCVITGNTMGCDSSMSWGY